jgi:D-aminopeptidase
MSDRTPSGKLRARGLGIPFQGEPGPLNAITDVAGVSVGYATIIRGEGPLVRGEGPVRTGVTALLPRGDDVTTPVWGGMFSLNGNGELTGSHWVEETGRIDGPITITNTHSVGVARDASIKWMVERSGLAAGQWALPVVGETFDGYLNDISGFHVTDQHVFDALDGATGGAIEEGSVGGGTGMICYGFKGGSGTASRVVPYLEEQFTLGAFVQANFGARDQLSIAGVPVGRHLPLEPAGEGDGSIIAVVATDAPLLPHQLKRLARRIALGVGRSGSIANHGSGDIFCAFSTANAEAVAKGGGRATADFLPDPRLNGLFRATVEAIDEAILNALVANETMTGRDGNVVPALPHDEVVRLLARHSMLGA